VEIILDHEHKLRRGRRVQLADCKAGKRLGKGRPRREFAQNKGSLVTPVERQLNTLNSDRGPGRETGGRDGPNDIDKEGHDKEVRMP